MREPGSRTPPVVEHPTNMAARPPTRRRGGRSRLQVARRRASYREYVVRRRPPRPAASARLARAGPRPAAHGPHRPRAPRRPCSTPHGRVPRPRRRARRPPSGPLGTRAPIRDVGLPAPRSPAPTWRRSVGASLLPTSASTPARPRVSRSLSRHRSPQGPTCSSTRILRARTTGDGRRLLAPSSPTLPADGPATSTRLGVVHAARPHDRCEPAGVRGRSHPRHVHRQGQPRRPARRQEVRHRTRTHAGGHAGGRRGAGRRDGPTAQAGGRRLVQAPPPAR